MNRIAADAPFHEWKEFQVENPSATFCTELRNNDVVSTGRERYRKMTALSTTLSYHLISYSVSTLLYRTYIFILSLLPTKMYGTNINFCGMEKYSAPYILNWEPVLSVGDACVMRACITNTSVPLSPISLFLTNPFLSPTDRFLFLSPNHRACVVWCARERGLRWGGGRVAICDKIGRIQSD